MIIWSPLPAEVILDGFDAPPRPALELRHHGRLLLVEPVSPNQVRLVRLISTDPNDFLHPDLQPGRIVDLVPQQL